MKVATRLTALAIALAVWGASYLICHQTQGPQTPPLSEQDFLDYLNAQRRSRLTRDATLDTLAARLAQGGRFTTRKPDGLTIVLATPDRDGVLFLRQFREPWYTNVIRRQEPQDPAFIVTGLSTAKDSKYRRAGVALGCCTGKRGKTPYAFILLRE